MAATFEFAPFVASGVFSNENSWSPEGGPPGTEDTAQFLSPATYNVNFDLSPTNESFLVTVGNATFRPVGLPADVLRTYSVESARVDGGNLTLTGNDARRIAVNSSGSVTVGATQPGSLTILDGASLNSSGSVIVGATQSGTLNILEGASLTGEDVFIANLENSSGQATFDASSVSIRDLHVGRRDVGNLTISGGAVVESRDGFLGTFPGGQGSLTISGPSSFSSVNLHVGRESIGTFTITGGAVVETSQDGFVGTSPDGQGAVTVTGAGSHWNLPDLTRTLAIGQLGQGELSVADGASLSAGILSIANETNSSGQVTFDASSVDSRNLHVGRRGTGTLVITGGAIVQSLEGFVGTSAGGQGTVTVTGAGSRWNPTRTLTIGGVGQGELSVADGASLSSGELFIAREDDSSGQVTLNAGSLSSEALHVGRRGTGTLTVVGGATVESLDAIVGDFAGSQGSLTINGASSFSSRDLHVGRLGTGTLAISGGATVESRDAFVATLGGSHGSLTVTGPSSFSSRDLHVGRESIGSLTITGGATVESSRDATVGADVTGHGTVAVAGVGSAWISQSSLRLGGNVNPGGSALLTIVNGGLVETEGELRLFPQATALVNGGTLRVGSIDNQGGAIHITNGTLHVTGTAGLTLGDGSFGDFLTLGTTQHLIVDHQLTIHAGALLLAHSPLSAGSLTNQGDLILVDTTVDGPVMTAADIHVLGDVEFHDLVEGSGAFFGSGTAIFNGGYSPGASPAVVTFEGNLAFGGPNTFTIELGGTELGQFDRLEIGGTASLGGALALELLDLGGGLFSPAEGDSFEIVSAVGGVTGTFAELLQPQQMLSAGLLFDIVYDTNAVSLVVAAGPGLPGDFNFDGVVDAADYTVWRDTGGTADHFVEWRDNFGAAQGGAAAAFAATAVPEPAGLVLACSAVFGGLIRQRTSAGRPRSHRVARRAAVWRRRDLRAALGACRRTGRT